MTKKNGALKVNEDLSGIFGNRDKQAPKKAEGMPFATALKTVARYMKTSGYRPRTISDYTLHVTHFTEVNGADARRTRGGAYIQLACEYERKQSNETDAFKVPQGVSRTLF